MYEKAKASAVVFWQTSPFVLDDVEYAAMTCWFVEAHAKFVLQGRELYLSDFLKYAFNIGLHSDTYIPVYFKLGMVVDMTKLHILRSVNTVMLSLNMA